MSASIGDWIEIDEFTVAPVIGYELPDRYPGGGFFYHACWQEKDGDWYIPHPTDPIGSPVRVLDKEVSTIVCELDYSRCKPKEN